MSKLADDIWFSQKASQVKEGLYVYAVGILKNNEDAEDALQNTLLNAYEHMGDLRFTDKFKPWIYRILTNECYKILNGRKYAEDIDGLEVAQETSTSIEDQLTLWEAVNKLKLEYRKVVILFYYEGMSVKSIASVLEIKEAAVKKRLSRAREMLKSHVGER